MANKYSIKSLRNKVAGIAGASKRTEEKVNTAISKADEALFWLNNIKNSGTVKTGEYEALTKLFTGQLIYLDTRDVSVAPHLLFNGVWEEDITSVFRDLCKPDTVFFDIGANFGYYSVIAGSHIDKTQGQIHLFDANPDLIPLLEKSMSVNGFTEISHFVHAAVGAKKGTVKLNRIKNLWGGSTLHSLKKLNEYRPIKDEFDSSFKVGMITVDDYCKETNTKKVDLIKIDIEGLEDEAYKGMRKTIKANPDLVLLLEFTFGAYKNSLDFFNSIKKDFKYVSGITQEGKLIPLNDYKKAKKVAESELLMLVARNKNK